MLRSLVLLVAGGIVHPAVAEDAFYSFSLEKLPVTRGKPVEGDFYRTPRIPWRFQQIVRNYGVLDGEGEIYFQPPWRIVIRTPKGKAVTGTLLLSTRDLKNPNRVRFRIEPKQSQEWARRHFYQAREDYFKSLQQQQIAGGAWFRYQELKSVADRLGKQPRQVLSSRAAERDRNRERLDYERTFQVFSGGRAISENLQLDRILRFRERQGQPVPLEKIKGITTAEIDWKPLLKGKPKPTIDPAARWIPHDQHALFFPSFSAMLSLIDEAKKVGNPLYFYFADRAEDSGIEARYQRQLCLPVSQLSRTFGPALIKSVAVTGGDPYFRMGTDIAILFEPRSARTLVAYLRARQLQVQLSTRGAKLISGSINKVRYHAVLSPRREVSSYVATIGKLVVVTNSPAQLKRLTEKNTKLAELPEYAFFRDRYRRTDKSETAFLLVSDATIRRWCGPRWRIGDSRRCRMAAVLSHYQAEHFNRLVKGQVKKTERLVEPQPVPAAEVDWQRLSLGKSGVTHREFNTLAFQTPISELEFDSVTAEEADAYRRWRRGYQSNWRGFFDPIALRISLKQKKFHADLTVMPLIENSRYVWLRQYTEGSGLKSTSGDRHPDASSHVPMAVGKQLRRKLFSNGNKPAVDAIRESCELFIDADDPFWAKLRKAAKDGKLDKREAWIEWIEENVDGFPFAVVLAIGDVAKAKEQLQKSPTLNLLMNFLLTPKGDRTTARYGKYTYYRRPFKNVNRDVTVFWSWQPDRFIASFSESTLKRALDRQPKAARAKARKKTAPWLGKHLAMHVDDRILPYFGLVFGPDFREQMQLRAWSNVPILNEWKRRYPKQDPVQLHEQHWHVRLTCPGGGKYVWNEKDQTMESTVYGHPLRAKPGPPMSRALSTIKSVDFGLTFEHNGLRAKMQFERRW